MNGQYAHALGLDLHVALDLDVDCFDLAKKIVQRRRLPPLMRQRQGQKFVDRVGGFGPEPADQRPPTAILAEQQRIKGKGRKRLRPRAPPFEPARGFDRVAFVPGNAFFADGTGRNTLRLSFTLADECAVSEGIPRLASLIRAAM